MNEISIKKNVVGREIKSIESELHKMKKHYFYILFNLRYFIPYDIVHYLEVISMLENRVMFKDREKLELEREMEEICRWWRNVCLLK